MFEIAAPYPAIQTISILPNPEFSDTEALTASVSTRYAMDGTRYTYVKRRDGRCKLQWQFLVTRNKGIELEGFVRAYHSSRIRVIDHNGRTWIGYFTNNPFELTTERKAGPAIQDWPVGATQSITLEFEGIEEE